MPHTPGPWRQIGLSGTFPAQTIGVARIDDQTNGAIHAQVNVLHRTEEARQTAEANARLIAAAPELLEACRLLMRAEPIQQGERDGAIMGRISTAIDAARAALEKVTGESK